MSDGPRNRFSSEPVYLRRSDLAPFWFPWLPVAIALGVVAIFTSGWVRIISIALPVALLCVTLFRLGKLIRSRRR